MRSLLRRRLRRGDHGAVAVIVMLCMTFVVLPMCAVTLDAGMLLAARSAAQNAADQAASAAAWAACSGRDPSGAATAAAARNGHGQGAHTAAGTVSSLAVTNRGNGSWGVSITVDVPGVFSQVVGVSTSHTSANAAASCQTQSIPGPAMYAHATCANSLQYTGNNIVITGDMHTNGQLNIVGNNISDTGIATYSGSYSGIGNHIDWTTNPAQTAIRTWPQYYNVADFDTGGTYATRADYVAAAGTTTINNTWLTSRGYMNGSGDITPKIYYTDGNIDISGNKVTGTATFVARGTITFSGNNITLAPHFLDISSFSANGSGACGTDAVRLTGNNITLTGIVFSPSGRTGLTGNNVNVDGTVIANQIQFTGNNKTVKTGRGSTTQGSPTVGFDAW